DTRAIGLPKHGPEGIAGIDRNANGAWLTAGCSCRLGGNRGGPEFRHRKGSFISDLLFTTELRDSTCIREITWALPRIVQSAYVPAGVQNLGEARCRSWCNAGCLIRGCAWNNTRLDLGPANDIV